MRANPTFFELCATFNYYTHRMKLSHWNKVHDVLPGLISQIAYDSRRDSGHELCFRCVRHLTNPNHACVRTSQINVIELISDEGNKMSLSWSCRIPASMKDMFYNAKHA